MESEFQMVEASNIFVSKFLYIFTATNQRILCCLDSEEMKERKEKKRNGNPSLVDEQMNKHEVLN